MIGDEMRLSQVIINFISNANKFTPMGGSVTVTFRQMDCIEDKLHLMIRVRDSGKGIREDFVKKIFRPYGIKDMNFNQITAQIRNVLRQINASASKNSTDTRQKENAGAGNSKKKKSARTHVISGEEVIALLLLLCYTAFAIYLILELQCRWRIRRRLKQKKQAEIEGYLVQFYIEELENILMAAKIYEGFGNSPDLWYNIK